MSKDGKTAAHVAKISGMKTQAFEDAAHAKHMENADDFLRKLDKEAAALDARAASLSPFQKAEARANSPEETAKRAARPRSPSNDFER